MFGLNPNLLQALQAAQATNPKSNIKAKARMVLPASHATLGLDLNGFRGLRTQDHIPYEERPPEINLDDIDEADDMMPLEQTPNTKLFF